MKGSKCLHFRQLYKPSVKAAISRKSHRKKFQQQLRHTSSTSCWVATKTLFGFDLPISTSHPTGSACLLMAKPHLSSKDPNLHTNDGTSNMVTWWPLSFCKVSINQNRTRHISPSSPSRKETADGPWQPNEIAALAKVTKP